MDDVTRVCAVCCYQYAPCQIYAVQELSEAAEHLRQNEVKKSTLKNMIWEKTLEWIKENTWAQTQERPAAFKSGEPAKQKK